MRVKAVVLSVVMLLACASQAMHYIHLEGETACETNQLHFCGPEHHHHCGLCDFTFTPIDFNNYETADQVFSFEEFSFEVINEDLIKSSQLRPRLRAPPGFKDI
ncbi:hypothetical protein GYB22_08725 [bacterium]|nr:hypothetical protein [bacterium]